MQYKISKQYLLFLFLLYTFLFNELLVKIVPLFKFEDELFAVASIWLFICSISRKLKKNLNTDIPMLIMGFVICSFGGTFYYNYQPLFTVALPDLLLSVKFWLCIYTSMKIFKNFDIIKYASKICFHIKAITWFYFLLSVINMFTGIFSYADYRFGLGSNELFYSHPTVLVGCCSLLIAMIFAIQPQIKHSFFYVLMLAIVMCTTLRAKGLADAAVYVVIYIMLVVKKGKFTIRSLILFIPVVFFIGWSQLEYYFFELGDESARAQLLMKSFQIAKEHFPFGAGFGTYGSHYSSVYYSPLYYKYGLNMIHGLSETFPHYICDSFWPMILGQAGYIGMLFYIMAIIKLIQIFAKQKNSSLNLYVSAVGVMCYLLVESIAATAFVHPLSMPLAIWMGILLTNITTTKNIYKSS